MSSKPNKPVREESLREPDVLNPFIHELHFTFLDKLKVSNFVHLFTNKGLLMGSEYNYHIQFYW